MKIAILEIECHAEVLRATMQLLTQISNFEITLFTTKEILNETGLTHIHLENVRLEFKKHNEKESDYLKIGRAHV